MPGVRREDETTEQVNGGIGEEDAVKILEQEGV